MKEFLEYLYEPIESAFKGKAMQKLQKSKSVKPVKSDDTETI